MRPYLAIIVDSFRAAVASRVLFVMLAIVGIILVLIAPFHTNEILSWKLELNDRTMPNAIGFARRLAENRENADEPGIVRIWGMLNESVQRDVLKFYEYDAQQEAEGETKPEEAFGEYGQMARQSMLQRVVKD